MKYIIFRDRAVGLLGTDRWPKGGQIACSNPLEEMPIIFPECLTHSVVMEQLQAIYPGLEPISAGSVTNSADGWWCEGKSISLQLPSRQTLDASTIDDSLWIDLDS